MEEATLLTSLRPTSGRFLNPDHSKPRLQTSSGSCTKRAGELVLVSNMAEGREPDMSVRLRHARRKAGAAPVRGPHPLARRPPGVTESGGRSRLTPLGNVGNRHHSPTRFVHDPELVCSRRFEWSALRKRADVGLEPVTNVATSMACPGPP